MRCPGLDQNGRELKVIGKGPSRIDARLEGIGHLLRDRRMEVPRFQRSFSWTGEQVDAFWRDLSAARHAGQNEYFLGTVVATPNKRQGTWSVIDGQQRLAVTVLLFAAIRDEFLRNAD